MLRLLDRLRPVSRVTPDKLDTCNREYVTGFKRFCHSGLRLLAASGDAFKVEFFRVTCEKASRFRVSKPLCTELTVSQDSTAHSQLDPAAQLDLLGARSPKRLSGRQQVRKKVSHTRFLQKTERAPSALVQLLELACTSSPHVFRERTGPD